MLKNLPADINMALVLIQHLDPRHASMLKEILSRETKLPVCVPKNNHIIKPGCVYVIPADKDMAVFGGKIKLTRLEKVRKAHMPIDFFFSSLAADQGAGAIGVILSGTASDGVNGLKAIKAAGGITFAQDEESAKYTGMPHNAFAAGCVDYVMSCDKIARKLTGISRHPYLERPKPQPMEEVFPENVNALNKIFFLLRGLTGVDFTHYKQSTIKRRIERRMIMRKTQILDEYVSLLRENGSELEGLAEDILITVTKFFREPDVYKQLQEKVFPAMMKNRQRGNPFRIWVPGCSTGEEVYSLAISLLQFLGDRADTIPLQIFGTDISDKAIEKARKGIYPQSIEADIAPGHLRRFFVKTEHGYQINKTIREMCIFAKHNITGDPPFSNIDLISCRNVLIYLGPILQKKVIPMFHYALKSQGYLILGSSEGIGGFSAFFGAILKKYQIYQKKPGISHLEYALTQGRYTPPVKAEAENITAREFSKVLYAQEEADRIIMNKYVPGSVLVNKDMEILRFWGHSSLYIDHSTGKASLNLFKIVRPELSMDIHAAIHEAKKNDTSVKIERIGLKDQDDYKYVNIEVVPITDPVTREHYFLIMFDDIVPPASSMPEGPEPVPTVISGKNQTKQQYIEIFHLRDELEKKQEYLQSIIEGQETTNEELQTSLEELQSSNEELHSINEEMETAKEELQSANEE
ncbi:MAG: CheR family methyltransferase, partial [Candidatus Margulisiibacteriota bacterium]